MELKKREETSRQIFELAVYEHTEGTITLKFSCTIENGEIKRISGEIIDTTAAVPADANMAMPAKSGGRFEKNENGVSINLNNPNDLELLGRVTTIVAQQLAVLPDMVTNNQASSINLNEETV